MPSRIILESNVSFEFSDQCLRELDNRPTAIKARYFRPPYGTVGARMRQRLAAHIDNPYIVNWSVDVEDWLWANTDEPWRQLRAFQRDVKYFRDFIDVARRKGKQIMRIDQCMMDPSAPKLSSLKSWQDDGEQPKMLRTQHPNQFKAEEVELIDEMGE